MRWRRISDNLCPEIVQFLVVFWASFVAYCAKLNVHTGIVIEGGLHNSTKTNQLMRGGQRWITTAADTCIHYHCNVMWCATGCPGEATSKPPKLKASGGPDWGSMHTA